MNNKYDKLANEKPDPIEGSNNKVIVVPIVMVILIISFGSAYLASRTKHVTLAQGDSRTYFDKKEETPAAAATPGAGEAKVEDLASLMEKGKQVFATTCQVCHQATGLGIPGAFPPLAGSEWALGPAKQMAAIVLHGIQGKITVKGQVFDSTMPPFQEQLKPEDIAAVLTYVRHSFGNDASIVTTDIVNSIKEATKDKKDSWHGEEELKKQKWD